MKIGFIGTGNMGGAILTAYAASPASKDNRIFVSNRTAERSAVVAETTCGKAEVLSDNAELCRKSDIIIVGVKPQGIGPVLEEIAGNSRVCSSCYGVGSKLIVSMAAGVSIATIEDYLGRGARIVRVMPNTPALVAEAMTSLSRNSNVSEADFARVREIFEAVGRTEEVPEEMIDCVIGVSGSSPAYTYMYIEALAEAAEENGMATDKARVFAAQAVLGAAKMVLKSSESIEQLRVNVCSPGGATIEAVNRLFENGFKDRVKEGVQAAVDRSAEMTEQMK